MSNIIELQAQNFKRLKAITIRPEGSTVVIGGRNAQGKSSTLDAIMAALGGGRAIPDEPIRHGEKKASIRVELDDLIVVRKFTKSGSKLELTAKDGSAIKKPQQVLDALTGALTFDPLAFCSMSTGDQLDTLRELAGLDLSDIDKEIEQLFELRKAQNRDAKRLRGAADSATLHKDQPIDLVVVSELVAELSKRQKHNDDRRELEKKQAAAERELAEEQHASSRAEDFSRNEIDRFNREIADLEAKIAEKRKEKSEHEDNTRAQATNISERIAAAEKQVATLAEQFRMGHWEDLDEVQAKIETAEETNALVRENNAVIAKRTEAKEAEGLAQKTTEKLEEARERRAKMIEEAPFPVDGLGIDEDGVSFNGVAFSQASGAEKIRVSASIGLAMNPTLKVLLIRDGSLLDADAMAALQDLASSNDAQIWLERVGDADECGIIIEDGEVVS